MDLPDQCSLAVVSRSQQQLRSYSSASHRSDKMDVTDNNRSERTNYYKIDAMLNERDKIGSITLGARRQSGYLAAPVALARVLDGGFGFALIRTARPSG
jgi:hypothetical protein